MSQSRDEGNVSGPPSSTSLKIGSSSGGGGDEQVGVVRCSPVFTNHLIIEKLVMYAMYDSGGKIWPRMVGTLRAVQKSWLDVTTTVLRKLEEPVITLNQSNLPSNTKSLNLNYEWLKTLEKFTKVFSDPGRLHRSFLPYKFIMDRESFREENYETVLDCLNRVGAELVELKITYPTNQQGIPPLIFPFLRRLSFNFMRTMLMTDNYNPLCSLQCILDGSPGLAKLIIDQEYERNVQGGIKFLRLPDTLVSLHVGVKLESQELEDLLFQLTKLEHLKVTLYQIPYQDGLLFKILNRFRKTLKRFEVFSFWPDRQGGTVPRMYLQFPVMERLETVRIDCTECHLVPGPWCVSGIQQLLPKLTCLLLYYQTEAMLAKWLANYKSDKIRVMGIRLINDQLEHEDKNFHVSIKREMLAQVKSGFPNLRYLGLHLNIGDMNVLKYLFGNMKELTGLQIYLSGEFGNDGSSKVDSIMLGIPLEVLRAMEYLKSFKVTEEQQQQPSIVDLTALRDLGLWTENWNIFEGRRVSLISDNFFNYALLKMPKLRELKFNGRFKPSDEMQKKWTEQEGRLITYSPIWE